MRAPLLSENYPLLLAYQNPLFFLFGYLQVLPVFLDLARFGSFQIPLW
jgi:hypothetical protein